ncbi:nuclear transport factor 2 family protein [Rhodococcus hoagii]|nr:nuclear transport factor 2 family protein [Prescottella equi]
MYGVQTNSVESIHSAASLCDAPRMTVRSPEELDALEDIRQLKYRYFRTLDLKRWDDFADALADDVVAEYGTHALSRPLVFESRDALVGFMRKALTPAVTSVHFAHHPEITVVGSTAEGSWAFEDTVIIPEHRCLIRGTGYYRDGYRRDDDGRWRITRTSYERIYESMISLDDVPSFEFLAHMWAQPPAKGA